MKIQKNSLTTFKSTPIYDVKLRKTKKDGTYDFVDAKFSRLNRDDEEDVKIMKNLRTNWARTEFGSGICTKFLFPLEKSDDIFYAIEGVDDKGKRKIYSLANFTPGVNLLMYLQASPKNKKDGIKGSGELMLWGIGRESSKDNPMNYIILLKTSRSKSFYEHVGMPWNGMLFNLTEREAGDFFKRIEDKYNLDVKV